MTAVRVRAGAARLLAAATLLALCLHAAHGPHLAAAARASADASTPTSPHGHEAAGRHGASHVHGGASGAQPVPDIDHCGVVAGLPQRADHGLPPTAVGPRPGGLFAATAVAPVPPDAPCRGDPTRLRALLQVFLV